MSNHLWRQIFKLRLLLTNLKSTISQSKSEGYDCKTLSLWFINRPWDLHDQSFLICGLWKEILTQLNFSHIKITRHPRILSKVSSRNRLYLEGSKKRAYRAKSIVNVEANVIFLLLETILNPCPKLSWYPTRQKSFLKLQVKILAIITKAHTFQVLTKSFWRIVGFRIHLK